jgi:isoleucyl-tRNA synthetase
MIFISLGTQKFQFDRLLRHVDELIEEGFVREIVSKLQTMRKEAGFNVTDHISITIDGSKIVTDITVKNADEISGDTLADEISVSAPQGFVKEWDINGEKVTIGVAKKGE